MMINADAPTNRDVWMNDNAQSIVFQLYISLNIRLKRKDGLETNKIQHFEQSGQHRQPPLLVRPAAPPPKSDRVHGSLAMPATLSCKAAGCFWPRLW